MTDLVLVRSKGRESYWISRGLFEKHPDDYAEVKSKAAEKKTPPPAE